jgi:hypothetical protein
MVWLILLVFLIVGSVIYVRINTNFEYHYDDNGKIKLSGRTRFRKRIGEFKCYDTKGFCYCIRNYEKGELVSERYFLKGASEEIISNRDIVLKAVLNDGNNLEFLKNDLEFDREIVIAALKSKKFNKDYIKYRLSRYSNDSDLIHIAVLADGHLLESASSKLKDNERIVLDAVKNNGYSIKYASDRLKSDKKVVVNAVNCDSRALFFINRNYRYDNEVIAASLYDWNKNLHNGYVWHSDVPYYRYLFDNPNGSGTPIELIPKYKLYEKDFVFNAKRILLESEFLDESLKFRILRKETFVFQKLLESKLFRSFSILYNICIVFPTIFFLVSLVLHIIGVNILNIMAWAAILPYAIQYALEETKILNKWMNNKIVLHRLQKFIYRAVRIKKIKTLKYYFDNEEFWAIQYAIEEIRLNQKVILDVISQKDNLIILAFVDEELKNDFDFNQKLRPYIIRFLSNSINKEELIDFYHYWFLGNKHLENDKEILNLVKDV